MVTRNVITRVLRIETRDGTGSAFVAEFEGRQYVITARHLVGDEGATLIKLHHERTWKALKGKWVGQSPGDIDIAVFAPEEPMGRFLPVELTTKGFVYGQDAYFLGFPYGMHADVGTLNQEFPLPFVKKAIISLFYTDDAGAYRIFLDGHNNPGFSGGPIVFTPIGSAVSSICGVIKGFRKVDQPVLREGKPTEYSYPYNTGIVVGFGIDHAFDVIRANPIGPEVT